MMAEVCLENSTLYVAKPKQGIYMYAFRNLLNEGFIPGVGAP